MSPDWDHKLLLEVLVKCYIAIVNGISKSIFVISTLHRIIFKPVVVIFSRFIPLSKTSAN